MPDIQIPAGQLNVKGPQSATGVDRWISVETKLTYTGLVLTCIFAFAPPVPVGAFAYTGLAPTLAISNNVTTAMPAGSLVYTGLVQTLRLGDRVFDLPAGQIVIKGPARPQVLSQLQAGTLTFTGTVTTVSENTPGAVVSIPVGVLALTGQTPDRIANKDLAVPAGSLVLTGQYVAVAFKQPDVGRLVYSGLAPTVVATSTTLVVMPLGHLTYAGLAPTIDWATGIPAGQLVIAAPAMEVSATGLIAIPKGTLIFTGYAVEFQTIIAMPVGSLVLTGPVLTPAHALSMGLGSLVYTGYQGPPSVSGVVVTNPDVFTSPVRVRRLHQSTVRIHRLHQSEVER